MRITRAEFITSVASGQPYIDTQNVEIAIVGKSNVGKSSFINSICNNRKLARVSQSPGKTRLINYFSINGGSFFLVDLPGYGFAKAPKTEKEKWGQLIEGYLQSGNVTHLFLLLDSRHPPTQDDRLMFHWIEYYSIPYSLVATKADKIARSKRAQAYSEVQKGIGSVSPPIGFSAQEKIGVLEILDRMEQIVNDTALLPKEYEEVVIE